MMKKKEIYWYFKAIKFPCECNKYLKPINKPLDKNWLSFEENKKISIEKYKNAIIAGRMGAENVGIKLFTEKNTMANSYIEVYDSEIKE